MALPEAEVMGLFEVVGPPDDQGILRDELTEYLTRRVDAFGG